MREDVVLALDCGLRLTGAAVARGGAVLAQESADLGRRQAAELPLMAERVLNESGLAFSDVGLMAVTCGPGYFTGIRVGVAYAAALAYGLAVRVVPVPSLAMLAASRPDPSDGEVLAVVYAGRGFVYAASFGSGSDALPVGEYGGEVLRSWMARHGAVAVSDDPVRAAEAAGLDGPPQCCEGGRDRVAFPRPRGLAPGAAGRVLPGPSGDGAVRPASLTLRAPGGSCAKGRLRGGNGITR